MHKLASLKKYKNIHDIDDDNNIKI